MYFGMLHQHQRVTAKSGSFRWKGLLLSPRDEPDCGCDMDMRSTPDVSPDEALSTANLFQLCGVIWTIDCCGCCHSNILSQIYQNSSYLTSSLSLSLHTLTSPYHAILHMYFPPPPPPLPPAPLPNMLMFKNFKKIICCCESLSVKLCLVMHKL